MKKLLPLFLLLNCIILSAQDLYIKTTPNINNQNQNIQIESFDDGSYVVAGYNNSTDSSKLFVKMFNKCGTELWAKEISDNAEPLDLVEMNIDSSQNIVLVGRKGIYNVGPLPYMIKLDQNGTLIYSKLLSSTLGYNSLIYSSSIAPNGDYYLFGIHRYTASPPNNQTYYVARLSPNGTLKWAKNLDPFAYAWGRTTATKDGGIVGKFANSIFKLDSLGNKVWGKNYTNLGALISPVETDSGYVFARYYSGGLDRGSLFSIRHDGSIQWTTDNFFNFFPYKGITRKNGNVLFPGSNHLNGNAAVFLEIEAKDGSVKSLKQITNSPGYFATDLTESKEQEIIFAGPDNRGFIPQLFFGKLNDTLGSIACVQDTLIRPIDPYSVAFVSDNPFAVVNNNDLTTSNFQVNITSEPLTVSFTECSFTENRGDHNLGNDTILCFGQSIQIGNTSSTFDSYLWSNGSTNKTIALNQSGDYWLQVIAACDTLRDTINIQYQPGILFSLGADTVSCIDSLVLGSNLEPSIPYLWSTGETTRTITVKNSGDYWVEHSNLCNSTRDTVNVSFEPPYPPIFLGNDTILCPKENITLGSQLTPHESFLWSTGSVDKQITVNSAGNYWLEASSACSSSKDTISIQYYPNIGLELGSDTSICEGTDLTLGVAVTLDNYLWSTGVQTPSIVVSIPGAYWLETQTNCGVVRDSIIISLIPDLESPVLVNDTTICKNEAITLNPGKLNNYLWSNGTIDSTLVVQDSGLYWVQTMNNCDTLRDSVQIAYLPSLDIRFTINPTTAFTGDSILFINKTIGGTETIWRFGNGDTSPIDSLNYNYLTSNIYSGSLNIKNMYNCWDQELFSVEIKASDFFAPTIFTPNGDLINDQFFPVGRDIDSFKMSIHDRWGKVVFTSTNIAWNGKRSNGATATAGEYLYQITVVMKNSVNHSLTGSVSLVR